MSPLLRVAPLALATATSALAIDLILPALPGLPAQLDTTVTLAQATVALFFFGYAGSQLLWGEVVSRWGARRSLMMGCLVVALTSAGCAVADSIETVLVLRAIQGVFAGASAVVVPSVIRMLLSERDAVRGIAVVGMAESLIPAAGPVAGAALLLVTDWRGMFWIIAVVVAALMPFLFVTVPSGVSPGQTGARAGYRALLGNPRYLWLTASQSACMGALMMFVASGPQVLFAVLALPPGYFAALQVASVAAFILAASQAGRLSDKLGASATMRLGAWVQIVATAAFVALASAGAVNMAVLMPVWVMFCIGLAIRGPVTIAQALRVPDAQVARASAFLMFCLLASAAAATQVIAPFISASFVPLASAMLVLSLAGAWALRKAG